MRVYKTENDTPVLTKYTTISNLSFAPTADLVGSSIPVNEFTIDINTTDDIDIGYYAYLYDDTDTMWAKYWVTYAEHIDYHTVRIRARSDVAVLDRIVLPAIYYLGAGVASVLNHTIISDSGAETGIIKTLPYTLDNSFTNVELTGFCPEQTARERLNWICFVLGAYVKDFFNDRIEILPIDTTADTLMPNEVYYKPSLTFNDWVTAVRGKYYSFTSGVPQTTDKYVTDSHGNTYIVNETEVMLTNPDAPSAAPENIIDIGEVYLLNEDNISAVLSHIAQWYFPRTEVDINIIDNGNYIPGERINAPVDDNTVYRGYINSTAFEFGHQAKASVHLTAADQRSAGNLIILYKDGTKQLDDKTYVLPVGYVYSIINPYLDITSGGHRIVYRPVNEYATGTIQSGQNTDTEECDPALDLDLSTGILHIISVDAWETKGGVIGVIQ